MNTLPLILTCLASGAFGAGATHFLAGTPQETGNSQDVSELSEAIASLREDMQARDDTIHDMGKMIDRMESEAELVGIAPERILVPQTDLSTSSDTVPANATNEAIKIGDQTISQAQFENWVRSANANIKAEEQAEREAARKIRDGERTEERVAALTTELGLDSRQQSEFRRHFEEQNVKRSELMAQARESGDRRSMRDAFSTMREEANADLQTFLSGEQYETYQESNNNRGGRGNRGGGGGNTNNGGGGGNNAGGGRGGGGRGGF